MSEIPPFPQLTGVSWIGGTPAARSPHRFWGFDPEKRRRLDPPFFRASPADVRRAGALAADAFPVYRARPGKERASFLRAVAATLESWRASIVDRAAAETALPRSRLEAELDRTCFQLRLFAGMAEDASWKCPKLDSAAPGRKPAPKPSLRATVHPLGPVVVFPPVNFPLAYSVAGGDAASALAAGCPVIIKAHAAHPGTSEIVGHAVAAAAARHGLPGGVFSLVFDDTFAAGRQLVRHPGVAAVGFTGSRDGGLALAGLAARRAVPIPFFGELSSLNPVFLLPGALAARAPEIARDFHASLTLCSGQYCTNPGLAFVIESKPAANFLESVAENVRGTAAATMLHPELAATYRDRLAKALKDPGVRSLARGLRGHSGQAQAALLRISAADFIRSKVVRCREIFGPASVVVTARDAAELMDAAASLPGSLTASVHAAARDAEAFDGLLRFLPTLAGRIIWNGFPTGLEVGHATVHGGPFPSTTDSRFTAVGGSAMARFLRPVCYQNFPEALLPDELRDAPAMPVRRLVDGQWNPT